MDTVFLDRLLAMHANSSFSATEMAARPRVRGLAAVAGYGGSRRCGRPNPFRAPECGAAGVP